MQQSKGLIPRVSMATLTLGATACGGPSPADIAKQYCEWMYDCDPEYVLDYYGSLRGCRDSLTANVQEFYDEYKEYYGKNCAEAMLEYYECMLDALDKNNECSWSGVSDSKAYSCASGIRKHCDFEWEDY
jgi:hypothetical protein